MAQRCLFFVFLILFAVSSENYAQSVSDNFDLGFSNKLNWQGDTAQFEAFQGGLRLNDERSNGFGNAAVFIPIIPADSICYSLDVELSFSASSSNYLRWWILKPNLDLDSKQGVYLDFGGVSGNQDSFKLIYQNTNGDQTLLTSSEAGAAAVNPIAQTITVCRDAQNIWSFNANATEYKASKPLADNFSGYTGFQLKYTSTRNKKFFFDNLLISPVIVDTVAPIIEQLSVLDADQVKIVFNESLDPVTASDVQRYKVNDLVPVDVTLNVNEVLLKLQQDLNAGSYEVEINGIADLFGNLANDSKQGVYTPEPPVQQFELLFSEIMADPTPTVGLPDQEYLELYNTSARVINLQGLKIATDKDTFVLPDLVVEPKSYLAIAEKAFPDFSINNVANLPSLTNSSKMLSLLSKQNILIDQVTYYSSWHESAKKDGGFSLERSNLNKPCLLGNDVWFSSVSLKGGTPGKKNSIVDVQSNEILMIQSAEVISPSTILVSTNRVLSNSGRDAFLVNGQLPLSINTTNSLNNYQIQLSKNLDTGQFVKVKLSDDAFSCEANERPSQEEAYVGLPEVGSGHQIVLNEIMYDPSSGGSRWIEMYNKSDKLIDLSTFQIAFYDEEEQLMDLVQLGSKATIGPQQYLVIADDKEKVLTQFENVNTFNLFEVDLPSFDEPACIQMINPLDEEIIWEVCYSKKWHNKAYVNTDGISLEKINPNLLENNSFTWTSASSSTKGTPTRQNGMFTPETDKNQNQTITLLTPRISPDGDGYEDLLQIQFQFDEADYIVNIELYDVNGRPIQLNTQDQTLGLTGIYTWDGTDRNGQILPDGTYILKFNYWVPGQKERHFIGSFSVLSRY